MCALGEGQSLSENKVINTCVFPPAMPEGRGALEKDAESLVIALDEAKQKLV